MNGSGDPHPAGDPCVPDDFMVLLGEYPEGFIHWRATCGFCGETFAYMTFPDGEIIHDWRDHQHLSSPNWRSMLIAGRTDLILRALGIPDEML